MAVKKKVSIGLEDFKMVIDTNSYYVDKTLMIEDLLNGDSMTGAMQFLRPRRFGKTLMLSTLKYFFDVDERDNSYLFDGLAVAENKALCEKHQNRYPVVFFTLKGITGNNEESFLSALNSQLASEYVRHSESIKHVLNANEKEKFLRIKEGKASADDFRSYLSILIGALFRQYKRKPIVLIDEYDVPLNAAFESGCFDFMRNLIRDMFSNGLKTNDSIQAAVITGCLQIAKNQIFTGLNNLAVHTVTDVLFSKYFGFTEDETIEMLRYYGIDSRNCDVQKNYDGYCIGDDSLYNPFSLLNFVSRAIVSESAECGNYWVSTSGNAQLSKMLSFSSEDPLLKDQFERLLGGQAIQAAVDQSVVYDSMMDNNGAIMGTLLFSGYLTAVQSCGNGEYLLRIPNMEVLSCFKVLAAECNKTASRKNTPLLLKAFLDNDIDRAEEYLDSLFGSILRSRDKTASESSYHFFLAAVLAMNPLPDWKFSSQDQGIKGFADFVLTNRTNDAIIIEEKAVSRLNEIRSAAADALKQIDERKYSADYISAGYNVKEYAIVYFDNTAHIFSKSSI